MDKEFTPPDHVNFKARLLLDGTGKISNTSIATIQPGGGGPTHAHTHNHDHLFVVAAGKIKVLIEDTPHFIEEGNFILVDGTKIHSVWCEGNTPAVVIGHNIEKSI